MFQNYYELDNGKQASYYIFKHKLGFSYGNCFKYLVRANRKANNSAESDLNKALSYIVEANKEYSFFNRLAHKLYNTYTFNFNTQFAEHNLAQILYSIIRFDSPKKIAKQIIKYMNLHGVKVKDEYKKYA